MNFSLQVDLFFYREPEEAKDKEEEGAAIEYGNDFSAPVGGDWSAPISDAQWVTDAPAPPIAAAPEWTAEAGFISQPLLLNCRACVVYIMYLCSCCLFFFQLLLLPCYMQMVHFLWLAHFLVDSAGC